MPRRPPGPATATVIKQINARLEDLGLSPFQAARRAGLPDDAIRYVTNGSSPSVERLYDIGLALDLDFHIGPTIPAANTSSPESAAVINLAPHSDRQQVAKSNILNNKICVSDELTQKNLPLQQVKDRMLAVLNELDNTLAKFEAILSQEQLSDPPDKDISEPAPANYKDHYRPVALMELAAAAGDGSAVLNEQVVGQAWFRRDWLAGKGLDPSRCNIIGVRGESMEPTLPDGCSILVDRNRHRRRTGGIYVLLTNDGLVVKRLGKDAAGNWQLESDHPNWPPTPWSTDNALIGEVMWSARSL